MSSMSSSVSPAWRAIIGTLEAAEATLLRWVGEHRLSPAQQQSISEEWRARRESCILEANADAPVPALSDIYPYEAGEDVKASGLRLWNFVLSELERLKLSGVVGQFQAHDLQNDARERQRQLQQQLIQEGGTLPPSAAKGFLEPNKIVSGVPGDVATAVPVGAPENPGSEAPSGQAPPPLPTPKPRRHIFEMLLDPRSIQWLLGLGGALMVVGLVILLWINSFFTPPKMAIAMGLVNVALLCCGWGLIKRTRYQLAGRAFTLLACLVMPLNLWYYHSQGLVTLDGHLWVAAVVVCALYGASAVVLKDEMFAYVFCAGVAMSGLLILADWPPSPQKFWEIASPATLLIVLGLFAIHSERAFPVGDGPFSRQRFGLAFFRSGHVLMAGGLLMLFIAKLAGDWLYEPLFRYVYESAGKVKSPICDELQWLALLLVLAATYAYVYSDLVVRRVGIYIHIAALTLLWAEMLFVEMLNLKMGVDAVIAVLAVTSLAVNLLQSSLTKNLGLTRSFPMFGLLLGLLPVILGTIQHMRFMGLREVWAGSEPRWTFVGAMLLAAVASRVGAHVYRHSGKWLSTCYFMAGVAATMVAAVAALAALGLKEWQQHAPIMMLIPIAYLIAARMYREHSPAAPLRWVAHAATLVMLLSSLTSAFDGFTHIVERQGLNLSLALFFLEAAVFYGLAAMFQRNAFCVHLATLMASGTLWQVLTYFGVSTDVYILAFAVIGLLLLFAYRFSLWERTGAAAMAAAAFQGANTLLSLAFVSSIFRGLSELVSTGPAQSAATVQWGFVGVCVTMLVIAMLAVAAIPVAGWRRWYIVMVVAEGAVTLLAVHKIIDLGPWQQVELFSVLVGLLLLIGGHIGWYREQERQSDTVSMCLSFGSLLTSVPLAIATWIDRAEGHFLIVNEIGFLLVSVLLLASGAVFMLRATTIAGAAMTMLYFATLLIFVPWSRLNAVAWVLLVGGGVVFGVGSVLAFFRDRLLTLPVRIRSREGIFKVLNWR